MSATASRGEHAGPPLVPPAGPDARAGARWRGLPDPGALLAAVRELRERVETEGSRTFAAWQPRIQRRQFAPGAHNLACYLALRRHDLRAMQAALLPWGLSTLGHSEPHVLASLDAVIASLAALCGEQDAAAARPALAAFRRGERRLRAAAGELFGARGAARRTRVMVTLDRDAADDYDMVLELVRRGMDCVRINCAHDSAELWLRMIANVRRAAAATGRECRVLVDLGGPRVRTGAVLTSNPERRLYDGDRLLLVAPDRPLDGVSGAEVALRVRCTIPGIVGRLRPGAGVWYDGGRLGAVVESSSIAGAVLRVTHARAKGVNVRSGRGLNFPHTTLGLGALTDRDRRDLPVVARHADMLGYSFVRTPEDIAELQRELARLQGGEGGGLPALVAKIETAHAVAQLPELIVQAAGRQPLGVMIARGDLALEIGHERLAEVQEEMLWLCEAAHVPVIWATGVLDRFVRKGAFSRAEVTDAAMAARAECVMLNKGPFIAQAVTMVGDIATRMRAHQRKKSPQLSPLRLWRHP